MRLVPAILFDEDGACGGKSKCVRGMQVLLVGIYCVHVYRKEFISPVRY